MSLLSFLKRFPDDDACWAHLEAVRWPNGPVCPHCGVIGNAHLVGQAHYRRCNACQGKFKVTHGTPFEGTHLPMRTWFTALYLVAGSSKGISSVKLGEHLGIGQKTAWFLGQRIRRMMEDKDRLLRGLTTKASQGHRRGGRDLLGRQEAPQGSSQQAGRRRRSAQRPLRVAQEHGHGGDRAKAGQGRRKAVHILGKPSPPSC